MRKLILGLAVSLDGFIEGPNGEYDWCFSDQDYGLKNFFKRIPTPPVMASLPRSTGRRGRCAVRR